jgi:phage pi2 protein 07
MFLLYPLFAFGSLVMTILSMLIFNWIVVLFADDAGNLPKCLKYFQTFDNTLDAGTNKFSSRYLNRVMWLMRNPAYGWDYYVFGLKWNKDDWTVKKFTTDGTTTTFFATSKNGAFNFYYEGKFGKWKFGWKAWNYFQKDTNGFTGTFGDSTHVPVCIS